MENNEKTLETDMQLIAEIEVINKDKCEISINEDKNIYKQRFRKDWLDLPEFKDWLREGVQPNLAFCIFCQCHIVAGKSKLLKHALCKKHQHLHLSQQDSYDKLVGEKLTMLHDDTSDKTQMAEIDVTSDKPQMAGIDVTNKDKLDILIKKERKMYKQRFRKAWLDLPAFKDWLREAALTEMAFCIFCKCHVVAGKSELLKHALSKKHQRNQHNMPQNLNDSLDKEQLTMLHDDTGEAHLLNIIDMRNDSLSQPSHEMKKAMVNQLEEDMMEELEQKATSLLGKESAILLSSHSAANLVAILTHCQAQGSSVICGVSSEIFLKQQEAIVKLGRLCCHGIANEYDGSFSLRQTEELLLNIDLSPPFSAVICYECPSLNKGGVVPPLDWIDELSYLSATHCVGLHCDGTRLLNAALALHCSSSRLVHAAHSITLALDKGLTAPVGALLAGDKSFIDRAKCIAKSIGVLMNQSQMVVTGCHHALRGMVYKLNLDHQCAKGIAEIVQLMKSKSVKVDISSVHTNVIHLITYGNLSAKVLLERLASATEDESKDKRPTVILANLVDSKTVSLVTHSGITVTDIIKIKDKLRYILKELQEKEKS